MVGKIWSADVKSCRITHVCEEGKQNKEDGGSEDFHERPPTATHTKSGNQYGQYIDINHDCNEFANGDEFFSGSVRH